jgi:septal ring factor EnvC (AmiA/AmiB activator)
MSDNADTDDNTAAANHSMPDPFVLAISLCQIATSAKAIEPALKRLRKLGHDIEKAERKLAAVTAQAEQTQARIAEREAAADERDRALDARATEFESSLETARAELHAYYNSIAEADRHLRYRILASADLLSGYNPQLQDLPSWDVLKRLVAGLPDDPPPLERDVSHPRIDAFADVCSDPGADRHGNVFLGTLSRDVSHRGAQ